MGSVEKVFYSVRAGVKSAVESLESMDSRYKPQVRKYEVLSGEKHTVVVDGKRYCRIRALRGFERPFGLPPVEVGDLGGYLLVDYAGMNLAPYLGHEGSCWVADGAFVDGQVAGDAQVTGRAFIGAGSKVTGKSLVSDFAQVVDGAWVQDSLVSDFAQVVGVELNHSSSSVSSTMVFGYSRVAGRARVSGGAKVCRFGQVFGSAVVTGRVQVRDGGVVGGAVVLVSECEVVDLPGGVIDEPLNRWGCPTVIVNRAGDEPVRSVKRFADPEHGCQLPVAGDGCPVTTFVDDERDVAVMVREVADVFGVEPPAVDKAGCSWASTYDKDDGRPRPIWTSKTTGERYFSPETVEEERERLTGKEETPTEAATGTTESTKAEGAKAEGGKAPEAEVPEPTEVTGSILSDEEHAKLKEALNALKKAEGAPGTLND